MAQDKREQLYRNLIGSGKVDESQIGSLNDFKNAIKDEKSSRQFHQNLIKSGIFDENEIGSEDDFFGSISTDFATKPQQPAKPQQKPQATQQKPSPIPEGFGELDLQQANQMAMGKGASSWGTAKGQPINPQTGKAVEQKKNTVQQLDKAIKGDKKAAKESGLDTAVQRMQQEREYYEATGKPLANIVNTPVTAPTAVRDESGQMLMGQTTDEQRVAQYQQQEREVIRKQLQKQAINPAVNGAILGLQDELEKQGRDILKKGLEGKNLDTNVMSPELAKTSSITSPESLLDALNKRYGAKLDSRPDFFGNSTGEATDFANGLVEQNRDLIEASAARLGMPVEDFVWQEFIPQVSEGIAQGFQKHMEEKYSVKDVADYLTRKMSNSVIGTLAGMSTMSKMERRMRNEELFKTEEGKGKHYNAGIGARMAGSVAMFAPDAPVLMVTGTVGEFGTKAIGSAIASLGQKELGHIVATGSPFLAANVSKVVKYGGIYTNAMLRGAGSMSTFMGGSSALQEMSTGDGTLSSIGHAALEGAWEGAKFGFATGAFGVAAHELGGRIGTVGQKNIGKKAAFYGGSFLVENQIFTGLDYISDPENFNWVDSAADAFYMQIGSKFSSGHGLKGVGRELKDIFSVKQSKNAPIQLNDMDRESIQRAFAGMDFAEIASDINNVGKILSDRQNIPWTTRMKVSAQVQNACESSRPRTKDININGTDKTISERSATGELIEVHKYSDVNELMQIRQQIEDRRANDDMISDYGVLSKIKVSDPTEEMIRQSAQELLQVNPGLRPQDVEPGGKSYDIVLDRAREKANWGNEIVAEFANECNMTVEEVLDIMHKKPIERVDDEQDLMNELAKRLHDAAYPVGEKHTEQSRIDGETLAGGSGVMNPETAAQVAQEYNAARDAYLSASRSEEIQQALEALGESARLDDIYMYIRDNFSGPEVDNFLEKLADYANAKAKKDGYIEQTGANIDEQVSQDVTEKSFHGTIDEEADQANIITITKDGENFILVNGNIGTRDGVSVDPDKSSGQIILRAKDGRFLPTKPDATMSIAGREAKEEYANRVREQLQVESSNTAVEAGLVNPEEEKQGESEQNTNEVLQPAPGQEEGAVVPEQETAISKIPTLKDEQGADVLNEEGDPQYQWEQAPVEDTLSALDEINHGDKKRVIDAVDAKIKASEKDVKAAEKLTPKSSDPIKRAKEQDNIDAQKAEAQQKVDYWTSAKKELEKANKPETNLNVAPVENNEPQNVVPLQPKVASEQPEAEKKPSLKSRLQQLVERYKKKYGPSFNDDIDVPGDATELVALNIGTGRQFSWEDKPNGAGGVIRGFKTALGINTEFGGRRGSEGHAFAHLFKGKDDTTGMGFDEFVDKVWRSDENTIHGLDGEDRKRFDERQIGDAIIDLFLSAESGKDITEYVLRNRVEKAQKAWEAEQARLKEEAERNERIELSAEEVAKIEEEMPFAQSTDEDIPDAPITKLLKEAEALMKEEGTPEIKIVDTDRVSADTWRELAEKANDGAFIGEEEIEAVKRYALEEGVFFDEETGKITVYSGDLTPEELRKRVQTIKDYINDRSNGERRDEAQDMEHARVPADGEGKEPGQESAERGNDGQGEGRAESSRESESSERDEYLKPRNEKEEKIVSDVEAKLAEEVKAAEEEVRQAKSALAKAQNKESERATDMFANDKAFESEDQIFSSEEMGLDTSAEGVEKRTKAERDAVADAEQRLERLKSQEEHDSRVRGALDNERKQTSFDTGEEKPNIFSVKENKNGSITITDENVIQDGKVTSDDYTDLYNEFKKMGGEWESGKGWTIPKENAEAAREAMKKFSEKAEVDPMKKIDETATEFRKEQDEAIGVTHNETPQQMADKEQADAFADTPLTIDEIDGSSVSDVQKTLAKAYLNGNQGVLQKAAYLNTYNDVRTTRERIEGNGQLPERGTQLDSGEDSAGRRPGRAGGPDSSVVETEGAGIGERQEQPTQQRVENSEGRLPGISGEGGDSGVSESSSELAGLSSGGVLAGGGVRPGVEGNQLGKSRGSGRSDGNTQKLAAGSDAAIAASKQRLAELRERFKKAGRNGESTISLVGMNNEQIGILMDITTESANLGYQYLVKGIREFDGWRKQMLEDFHDWLQEDMKWSDAEIDEYLNEVWNCEYNIDGVTRTIREWASFIGEEKLREVVREDLGTKFEKQKAAESIEVKTGDVDNIRETLPYLLPEQHEDVLRSETQFFDETHQDREHGNGKGYMFTNGTGTGKTYTGLGIAKRFVKQGKGRVLILTPSQEKVSDWKKDGLNLGLNIEDLDTAAKAAGTSATKAKGKGVVVTTYANARQNLALLEDCFDLVIYDESHKITEGKEAAEGEMFKFHQMLTNKDVEKSIDRQTYYLPLWVEQRNLRKEFEENAAKIEELDDKDYLSKEDEALKDRLNKRQLEVQQRLAEIPAEQQPIRESKRAQAEIDSKVTKTVFLSATPFNTRENLKYAEGYIFSYPEEDKETIGTYNHRSPEEAFLEQTFPGGYRWRYGRLESHISNQEALGRQEIDFSDYLQNNLQTMSGRMIDSEWDYSRDFPVLTLDHAGRFNQAMSEVYRNKKYQPLAETFRKAFDYNYSTALFEAMKTSLVIDRIKEHLKRGQKVVVFHRRRTSGDLEPPFERALTMARIEAEAMQDQHKKSELLSAIHAFETDFKDMLQWEQTLDYTLPRDQIAKVFGEKNIGFFSGAENKKTKHTSVEDFMKDNGGKDIIVIQEASGKEGISLHDQTGEHQRVEINLALPQSPIAFIQIEGRIYRIGQKSNAVFEYPLLGLDLETSLFAQKFNSALGTTENLALGSKARNLRQSIANAVLENSGEIDYERQGFGGKDMDGQVASRGVKDGFDVAISDYYGNQKMKRGRDNREGVDYFPTPEPIGWKMVEWAQLLDEESVLEPSAGHGAIARYVPETNPLTAVEPSAALFSRLQMRAGGPGRKFEEKTFEDYPLQNKHDAILMNPPYGVGGKTAMEHVGKAFKHLNEGGRLIAIIPDGPATEKRVDAWLASTGYDGVNGSAVVIGEVKLPDVAFGRAGTSVRTRILVIDKVSREEMRRKAPQKVTFDISNAKTVEDMFEQLRTVRMPERTIDQVAINTKKALKTKKALESNPFTSDFNIYGDLLVVRSRSRYDVAEIRLDLNNPSMQSALIWYKNLKQTMENPEELEYGKYNNKTYGRGKDKIPAIDAIKDYCQQAIKTLENVMGVTADQMDRMVRERDEETRRRIQEREAETERIRQEKRERINTIAETAVRENPNNSSLTEDGIRMNIVAAHSNDFRLSERSKNILRNAGIDWQTGEKLDLNEPVNARTSTVVEQIRDIAQRGAQPKSDYQYKLDKNTRTGDDMHLVSYNGARLSDNDYRAVERRAKAYDGYYNRFKKAFHFKTEEDARKFADSLNGTTQEPGTTTRFRLREKEEPKKTQKVYKLMRLGEDGKLYPLFIDSANPTELGKWYDADSPDMSILKKMPEGTFIVDYANGTYKTLEEYAKEKGVKVGKNPSVDMINEAAANGQRFVRISATERGQRRYEGENRKYMNIGINGSGQVGEFAMRPGWHAGSLPSMRQIGKGRDRNLRDDKFVWVEGEVPADKNYQNEANMNPDKDIPTHIPEDGFYMKATNANKEASQADRIGWYVAGAFKANRIMSDREARKVIDDWNEEHPDQKVEYDFDRESGKEFNAETMQLEDKPTTRFRKREKTEQKLNNERKDEKSEDLFLSLPQKEGEQYNETVNELASRVVSGRARLGREDTESGRTGLTAAHIGAEIISADKGGVPAAASIRAEHDADKPVRAQIEKSVEDWAKASGYWKEEDEFAKSSYDGKMLTKGGESRVYLSPDGKTITKFNDPYQRNDGGLLKALRNIEVFNKLFPESAYKVVGFSRDKEGRFNVVVEQPFIQGKQYSMEEYFQNGIDKKVEQYFEERGMSDIYGDGLEFGNEKYYVKDTHHGNIVEQKDGSVVVIDANAKYNEQYKGDVYGKDGFMLEDVEETETRMRSRGSENTIDADFRRKEEAGRKLAKKLNVDFEAITSPDQIKNKDVKDAIAAGKEVPGWVEIGEDGKKKIYLYLPHVKDTYDAEKTIAHETIGHYGFRELLGEKAYKSYMRSLLFDLKNEELSKYMEENLAKNGFDTYRTIDEFLADAAEKGYGDLSMWQKVKNVMTDALRSVGFTMSPSISDVKYMVWLSKHNLEKGNVMNQIEREALLYKLGQEKYEAKVKNGEFAYDSEGAADNTESYVPYFPGSGKTLFRHTPSVKNQRRNYERSLKRIGYVWKEAHIDAMQSAIELMRSISGVKKIEDIPSAENFVLLENQMSSKEEQLDFLFNRDYMEPLDKAVAAILPDMGKGVDEQLKNLQLYMIKKHGLERNRVLFVRDSLRDIRNTDKTKADQLEQDYLVTMNDLRDELRRGDIDLREYFEEVDNWIKHNLPEYKVGDKDYSGLTDLYGVWDQTVDSDAIDEVMSIESMLGDARVKNLWDKTKAVSQFGLDTEYEGGIDSKEKHDKVSQMFEWYVPLRGYNEKTAEEVYDYLEEHGSDRKWAGPVLMNAKGRESLADIDVFAALGAMSSNAINRALRNQMKQAFARFVRNHYNEVEADNRLVTELSYLWAEKQYNPAGNEIWVEKFPDIPEGAKADDIAQIIEQYNQDMKTKQAAGDAKRVRQNSNIPFRPADREHKAQHIVDVWINGEKHSFIINGSPRAAQAINGQLKAERRGNFAYMSSIKNVIAKLATSYNPDFIISNAERDAIFSASAIGIKESSKYFAQWVVNYFGRGFGRVAAGVPLMKTNLFNRYKKGELNMSNPTDRYFSEFMKNGGETGWVESKNIDKWKKLVKENVNTIRNRVTKEDWQSLKSGKLTASDVGRKLVRGGKDIFDLLPHAIEVMNERAENMARFATYMTSRQMGRSITRSVSDAKEVSVNFNRKGAGYKTRDVNKDGSVLQRMNALVAARTAQYGQDYIMFYNAGVQGLNNAAKLFRDHTIKASTVFTGFALGAFIMSWINQGLIDSEDEDKRGGIKNPYAELPEYIRRNNLCLYIGKGQFLYCALPIELRAMYGIGDMAAGYTEYPDLKSEKPVWKDVTTQLTQILPIDFMGEHPGNPLVNFTPSAARPILEIGFNENYYGRPIEKENYGNDSKPRHTRAYRSVNKAYMSLAKKWNAATNDYSEEKLKKLGVDEEMISEADYNQKGLDGWLTDPSIAQHIVESYFAGLGKTAGNLAHVYRMIKEDNSTLRDVVSSDKTPILRKFHYSPTEQNKQARTRNKWYYYKDQLQDFKTQMNSLKEFGAKDPIAKMKEISIADSIKATKMEIMSDSLKAYNKQKKICDDPKKTESQKEAAQMRMDQIMENTVRGLDKIQ